MDDLRERLEPCRPYLLLLAEWHLPPRFRRQVDPADVVQQTFARAVQLWGQYKGTSPAELRGWLQQILHNVLIDVARALGGPTRDVGRECSLERSLQESSAHLGRFLAAEQCSPSQRLQKEERLQRLAGALAQLTEAQRTAVQMRHLQGRSLDEISAEMERSPAAVGGLLRDGLRALRRLLGDEAAAL